jgi:hypothetical protein
MFVSNRVREIQSQEDTVFYYVNTKDNPADIASRGCPLSKLKDNTLWWKGPTWMIKSNSEWPVLSYDTSISISPPTCKGVEDIGEVELTQMDKKAEKNEEQNDTKSKKDKTPFAIDIQRFSTLNKLLRTTAWCNRFVGRLKGKHFQHQELTCQEIEQSENMWINHTQTNRFSDVLESISK